MARLNVYLPDELAAAAKASGLNLSAVTQEAVRRCLDARTTDAWLATLHPAPRHRVTGSPTTAWSMRSMRSGRSRRRGTAEAVVDASALVDLLLGGDLGDAVQERLAGQVLHAPAHADAEVLSALGRLHRAGEVGKMGSIPC